MLLCELIRVDEWKMRYGTKDSLVVRRLPGTIRPHDEVQDRSRHFSLPVRELRLDSLRITADDLAIVIQLYVGTSFRLELAVQLQ